MAEMHAEVFKAFQSIGVSEDKAIQAAVALSAAVTKVRGPRITNSFASRNDRDNVSERDTDIEAIRKDITAIKLDIIDIKGEMTILKWMARVLFVMTAMLLFRVFTH